MKKLVLMLVLVLLAGMIAIAALPADAAKEQVMRATTMEGGTYMDWMKTVYNRAGNPDVIQMPISTYDNNFELHPVAAESWSVSEDGLTWTFKLRPGMKWSDGTPLTAKDYVFALERAVTQGYDFAWYWSWAGGVKNWGAVESGELPLAEFGVKAVDDITITVETTDPKPYFPGVAAFWFPVPKHAVDKYGDEYATKAETLPCSGPFMVTQWVKGDRIVLEKNPHYIGPWQPMLERIILYPSLDNPEVAFPAFLAGDIDGTALNVGQLAFASRRFPELMRPNVLFQVYYLAFDYEKPPFNDANVRKALFYAVNRDEVTSTILKDVAVPARTLCSPGFPGYSEEIASQTGFNPTLAKEYLAKAGYPDGKGFPKVDLWYRIEGGYHAPIVKPLAEYLQAQFKKILGIDIGVKGMELKTWMDGLTSREHNFFLSPYMYDYVDASNFFSIFQSGGRHNWNNAEYDALVREANSLSEWAVREPLYIQAEQLIVDDAAAVYLVHALENKLVAAYLKGPGQEANKYGLYPQSIYYTWCNTYIAKK